VLGVSAQSADVHQAAHTLRMASLGQLSGQGDVYPLKVCSAAMQYGYQIHHRIMACHQALKFCGVVNVGLK
jgi:hypothetical protein